MNAMVDFLSELRLGSPQTAGQLTMIPLSSEVPSRLRYLTLGEALAQKLVDVTEVGASGHVPEVQVTSRAADPVLFLDGDALVGARQNRVLNLTVLVAAHSTTVVPVSCVEAGRWSPSTPSFSAGDALHFARARAAKMADVSGSMRRTGAKRSNQGGVWQDMAAYGAEFRVVTSSGAMQDIFESVRAPVENVVERLGIEPGQRGAAFVVDGELLGLDVLSSAAAFAHVFPKLVRSYAVEGQRRSGPAADKTPTAPAEPPASLVRDAIARMRKANWREYAGVGIGSDFRLTQPGLNAGALIHDVEVIHLAAFTSQRIRTGPERGGVRV
jgi:hypothetical protein